AAVGFPCARRAGAIRPLLPDVNPIDLHLVRPSRWPLRETRNAGPAADCVVADHIHIDHLTDCGIAEGACLRAIEIKGNAGSTYPKHAKGVIAGVQSTCARWIDYSGTGSGVATDVLVVKGGIVFRVRKTAGAVVRRERI